MYDLNVVLAISRKKLITLGGWIDIHADQMAASGDKMEVSAVPMATSGG